MIDRRFLAAAGAALGAGVLMLSSPAPAQVRPDPAAGPRAPDRHAAAQGYYRTPALAGDSLLFCAEGDLWRAPLAGGRATRITTHPGDERLPVISPDGSTVAFVGEYEGAGEVYTMPVTGGLPVRRTFHGGRAAPVAWRARAGTGSDPGESAARLIVSTQRFSTLPDQQLAEIDLGTGAITPIPLAQAADGCFDDRGVLIFTRLAFQGSYTRRYAGGTAQNLWRYDGLTGAADRAKAEATPLTADFSGTSASPMFLDGRVYFRSDRAAPAGVGGGGGGGGGETMNIWSMTPDGKDLRRHTFHDDYEVKSPSMGTVGAARGLVAYQLGADIWVLDVATGKTTPVPIELETDLDQTRERWITEPMKMLTSAHLSADGERVAITARGRVFVAPRRFGRLAEVSHRDGVRCRDARFLGDGKNLLVLSDQSGEVELWIMPANGVGNARALTTDADVLRWEAVPAPDGKHIAHHDKDQRLFIYDAETRTSTKIDENPTDVFADLRWSPDSRWLAYAAPGKNFNTQIKLYDAQSGAVTVLTTDRTASSAPAWDAAGEFLYFLSDRNLKSVVGSPWGSMQPEPFFDKRSKVYALALRPGLRSPFAEPDELHPATKHDEKEGKEKKSKPEEGKPGADGDKKKDAKADPAPDEADKAPEPPKPVEIDLAGIQSRVLPTPVPPGNYAALLVNDKALFMLSAEAAAEPKYNLVAMSIEPEALKKREWKVETLAPDIKGYELSQGGKSLLVQGESMLAVLDASAAKPEDLGKLAVKLDGWKLSLRPREEWRQMYAEAWRLHRDYFYDRNMHGVDWKAVRAKYAPLVDRVACRADLSDILGQMIAELSALHHFVVGGDTREGPDRVEIATLGAVLSRQSAGGAAPAGWKIDAIYESDPDRPELTSPLAAPGLDIRAGDVITMIDGMPAADAPDPSSLLRNKAGRQVLIHTRRPNAAGPDAAGNASFGDEKPSIVVPAGAGTDRELRYRQWELERRKMVEELGKGDLAYVHLRAMGEQDIADFAREFYPVFNRKGLVIDVRHNGGGNIDSWVLSRLMRKAWFYWQGRVGDPTWNMQYAFRGHMVVLCDEHTGSDGEAFSEGFRRLGLGKVIGTRTWGGEIWLSFSNYLVDKGIASAAETGVYGPEGTWLIEGRGVEPDVVVDNLPAATARGEDAQLKAAVEHLQQRIKEQPVEVPPAPKRPDKAWKKKG